jgi:serine/threonine protein kinase
VLTGGTVFGEYKLLSPLGRGPKASVWVATRIDRDARVALKILEPGKLPPDKMKRRLDALVRAVTKAGRFEHANLPGVYGTALRDDGLFGMACEYFDGGPFENMGRIADPLVLDRVLQLLTQLGTLLAWLHDHDVVHGNIKPANVLVTPGAYGPTVKLLDLCWSMAGLGSANARPFVSPEANVREPITPLTDQWAMAKLLHQLAVHSSPEGSSPTQALTAMPIPVLRVLKRAMENSPRARFQSMSAFVQALEHAREEILDGEERPVATREPTVPIAFEEKTAPHPIVGKGAADTAPGMPQVQRPDDDTGDYEPVDAPTESGGAVQRPTLDLGLDPTDNLAPVSRPRGPDTAGLGAINPSADAMSSVMDDRPVRPQDPTDRFVAAPKKKSRAPVFVILVLALVAIAGAGYVLLTDPQFLEARAPTASGTTGAPPVNTPPPVEPAKAPPVEPPPVKAPPVETPPPAKAPPVEPPPSRPDVDPAIVDLQKKCEGGSSRACVSLGERFEDGRGIAASKRSALVWFERACSLRSTSGCLKSASTLVSLGQASRARRVYERACDARNATACEQLADLWRRGVGGRKSERTADAFSRRACEFGLRRACK